MPVHRCKGPLERGQDAGHDGRAGRSQQRCSGGEFGLPHPPAPVAATQLARLGWESSGITPDDYHFEVLAQFLASPLCPTASIASEVCRYVDTRPLHTLSCTGCSCEHCKYNGPRCSIQHLTHTTEKEMLLSWF